MSRSFIEEVDKRDELQVLNAAEAQLERPAYDHTNSHTHSSPTMTDRNDKERDRGNTRTEEVPDHGTAT